MGLEFKIIKIKDRYTGVLRKRISVLEYLAHEIIEGTIYITVVSNRTLVKCSYCFKESKKLHSYYTRSFQDLPIQDKKVLS